MKDKKSLFITIEGIEGAGKSSLQKLLAEELRKLGGEVVTTREPGGTKLGEQIRKLLLGDNSDESAEIDSLTELLLFSADRAQHIAEVIRPALERGAVVICDRFIHSTFAYQGFGRGISLELLHQLSRIAASDALRPDLVILLDLSPQIGLQRVTEQNRFEKLDLEFHQKVRNGFLELSKDPKNKFVVIDGTLPVGEVFSLAMKAVKKLLDLPYA